jgi:hypothetical protein
LPTLVDHTAYLALQLGERLDRGHVCNYTAQAR